MSNFKIEIEIPFPPGRYAEIAYHALRVDKEPKRNGVTKELSYENNTLKAVFTAELARQLRVAVTGFYENIHLAVRTFQFCGEPVNDTYDYFYENV